MSEGLHIRDVSAGYGPRRVLHDITLPQLQPGTITAVVGPNAAGKSTFMKVLAGLLPSGGKIVLNGEAYLQRSPSTRAKLVGYLPQNIPAGSGLLAYESVLGAYRMTSGGQDAEPIERVFRMLDLENVALRPVSELSGGKRQLVGLAQVLVREPRLLLLDEPTSALDLRWQIEVLRIVREAVERRDAVALVCVHDINLAMRFCDTVAVLSEGRLLAAGPPSQAITSEILKIGWQVEARIENCSLGYPVVLADEPVRGETVVPMPRTKSKRRKSRSGGKAGMRDD